MYEAHGSVALQALDTKRGLAEGRVGGPAAYQTYILLVNTNTTDAYVSITFLRESGAEFDEVVHRAGQASRLDTRRCQC